METAWIKVFVMSLTQCIAPAGKIICQEETVEYQFANEADCTRALVQMMDMASHVDNVLIDRQKSDCRPAVTESSVYANDAEAKSSLGAATDVLIANDETPRTDYLQTAHDERLQNTKTCEETSGVAPCRIGSIIVEPAAEAAQSDVWKRQK